MVTQDKIREAIRRSASYTDDTDIQKSDENRREEIRTRKENLEADNIEQDISLRKTFSSRIFWFMALWMVGIWAIVFVQPYLERPLSDNVLICLISGATIKVLGIFFAVVKYLFGQSK